MYQNDNSVQETLSSLFLLGYKSINMKHKQKPSCGHVTDIISCYGVYVSTLRFHAGWGYNNCLELFAGIIRPL